MTLCHTPRSGCAVALFHQVRCTGAADEADGEVLGEVLAELVLVVGVVEVLGGVLLLDELPLHAAAAVTVAAARATAASARLLRIGGHLPER
jgi:hypothetical protein